MITLAAVVGGLLHDILEDMPRLWQEAFASLIDRAVNGPRLPDYVGVPDSGPKTPAAGDLGLCCHPARGRALG